MKYITEENNYFVLSWEETLRSGIVSNDLLSICVALSEQINDDMIEIKMGSYIDNCENLPNCNPKEIKISVQGRKIRVSYNVRIRFLKNLVDGREKLQRLGFLVIS